MHKLKKPYTKQDRIDFVVKYHFGQGLNLQETNEYLYALEDNEIIQDGEVIIDPDYEQKQAEIQKQERIKEIKTELDEIDKKRIRAICEPSEREDGITWLDYYNQQIKELREEMEEL